MYTRKLYKIGESLAFNIPKEYLRSLGIKVGSKVNLLRKGDWILIYPIRKYSSKR